MFFFQTILLLCFLNWGFFHQSQDVKNNENGNDGDSDYETFTFALWFSPSADDHCWHPATRWQLSASSSSCSVCSSMPQLQAVHTRSAAQALPDLPDSPNLSEFQRREPVQFSLSGLPGMLLYCVRIQYTFLLIVCLFVTMLKTFIELIRLLSAHRLKLKGSASQAC